MVLIVFGKRHFYPSILLLKYIFHSFLQLMSAKTQPAHMASIDVSCVVHIIWFTSHLEQKISDNQVFLTRAACLCCREKILLGIKHT